MRVHEAPKLKICTAVTGTSNWLLLHNWVGRGKLISTIRRDLPMQGTKKAPRSGRFLTKKRDCPTSADINNGNHGATAFSLASRGPFRSKNCPGFRHPHSVS